MDIVILILCSLVSWVNFFNAVYSLKEKYRLSKKFDFEWFAIALVSGVFVLFITYVVANIIVYGG